MTDGPRPILLVLRTTEEIPDTRQNVTFIILFLHAGAAEKGDETEEATDSRRCVMQPQRQLKTRHRTSQQHESK